jgi:RimJ/RimL family protein N-acetyltransferase
MTAALEFFGDPRTFLDAAGGLLAANPVESTVVGSVTARAVAGGDVGSTVADAPRWWLVVRDEDGAVVGAAMRTAPAPPHPPYLLGMPEGAARELARVLLARGEEVAAVNGASPATTHFADELAGLTGRTATVRERMRLYEVTAIVDPPAPAGRLVRAAPDDLEVVFGWYDAFAVDAAEQAGQSDPHPAPIETRESTLARIEGGEVWLWERAEGEPVHVTAFNPPSFGVARVGPVYTPPEHRGHGYAAAAVALVSRRLLDEGHRVCLFADAANLTSCGVYERLGYRPVVDMANLVLE